MVGKKPTLPTTPKETDMSSTITVPAPSVSRCGRYHSIEISLRKYTVCPQGNGKFVIELVNRDRFGGYFWICRNGVTAQSAWVQNISPFESLEEAIEVMTRKAHDVLAIEAKVATCVPGVRAPIKIPHVC